MCRFTSLGQISRLHTPFPINLSLPYPSYLTSPSHFLIALQHTNQTHVTSPHSLSQVVRSSPQITSYSAGNSSACSGFLLQVKQSSTPCRLKLLHGVFTFHHSQILWSRIPQPQICRCPLVTTAPALIPRVVPLFPPSGLRLVLRFRCSPVVPG